MLIEEFFFKSEGKWNSMRSGHSLAFQEFDEIRSKIDINRIEINDPKVIKLLKNNHINNNQIRGAYLMKWKIKNDWLDDNNIQNSSGESILLPLEVTKQTGKIIRSLGYSESIKIISSYKFLDDATLIITTKYNHVITEERIWFLSDNLRSRSSVTRSAENLAILQTSYASEIRYLNI